LYAYTFLIFVCYNWGSFPNNQENSIKKLSVGNKRKFVKTEVI